VCRKDIPFLWSRDQAKMHGGSCRRADPLRDVAFPRRIECRTLNVQRDTAKVLSETRTRRRGRVATPDMGGYEHAFAVRDEGMKLGRNDRWLQDREDIVSAHCIGNETDPGDD